MALGGQIIHFVRLNLLYQTDHVRRVGDVAVVHVYPPIPAARALKEVLYTARVGGAGPAPEAVYFVSLLEQELRQIRPVLTRNAGNQRSFTHA